jgi:hypothetical protein
MTAAVLLYWIFDTFEVAFLLNVAKFGTKNGGFAIRNEFSPEKVEI